MSISQFSFSGVCNCVSPQYPCYACGAGVPRFNPLRHWRDEQPTFRVVSSDTTGLETLEAMIRRVVREELAAALRQDDDFTNEEIERVIANAEASGDVVWPEQDG